MERGGTGKPTADEVGQASQLPTRWDRQANCRGGTHRGGTHRGGTHRGGTHRGGTGKPTGGRRRRGGTGKPPGGRRRGGTGKPTAEVGHIEVGHRGGTSRWDRQANRRAPSKIMDRQAKITILSERCAVLDWVPSSGLDWTPRRTAIIESSRSRATGFRTRRTLLVRRSACRRRRMSARIVSTPLPRARSSHARESRAFQV